MGELVAHSSPNGCPSGCRAKRVRRGHFTRRDDRKRIQRYQCGGCGGSYSDATHDLCFRQKKRSLNRTIFLLLTGVFSQRRTAIDLEINRKTVERKFIFLSQHAQGLSQQIAELRPRSDKMEFDDLESSIHTKCKPVSVCLAVVSKERWILGYCVASMPAKGKLAAISRKKYGPRTDERKAKRETLFTELKERVEPKSLIKSDQNPDYVNLVKRHFPDATHKLFKGQRGCVAGQGELKKIGYDPLFSINHTCAMLRANINRLIRRTWCTTKRQDRLDLHIGLYVLRHNLTLLKKKDRPRSIFTSLP